MAIKFKNNATGTLAAGLTDSGTTLELATGHGDRFPAVSGSDYFYGTLADSSGNKEIVKVTARTSGQDTMTIVRAQESTTGRAWSIDDVFELRLTAGVIQGVTEDIVTNAAAIAALGTMSSQDNDSVDINGGAIDGVTIGAAAAVSAKIDNESADVQIKARDHGTATTPEVVNVIYGTGSPPSASGVPIGTLFIKYTA